MSSGNAKIGHPAPQFKATAVVDGQFKEIQLSDYMGKDFMTILLAGQLFTGYRLTAKLLKHQNVTMVTPWISV
jgi:hypothetical protein